MTQPYRTFRANRQVDPTSNNPLYFDKARAGHMVSEEIVTPKKLCHVNSVEEFSSTLKDDGTQKEKTVPNFPHQDSSSAKQSLAISDISHISTAADPPRSPTKFLNFILQLVIYFLVYSFLSMF